MHQSKGKSYKCNGFVNRNGEADGNVGIDKGSEQLSIRQTRCDMCSYITLNLYIYDPGRSNVTTFDPIVFRDSP